MDFSELIAKRRSCRAFAEGTVLPAETLTAILHDAQMAPSWKNSETARYYAAVSPEAIAAVRNLLPGYNQDSTKNAAAYVVTTFKKGISGFADGVACSLKNGDEWGAHDLGLASAYFVLSAASHGYDTLIMGLHDAAGLRAFFNVPEDEELMTVIAVGRAASAPVLRPRLPLNDIVTIK